MPNEILWIVLLLASFSGIILAYRFFGKTGLYAWTVMAIVIANIQVLKTIQIFGFVTALGNIIYSSIFLVTDILCENHSKKDARKAVMVGFFVMVAVTILMQICLAFIPHSSDIMSPHIEAIFSLFFPILIASLSAYLASQFFDVWWYTKLKQLTKGRYLWLRNNISTMLSQLIDNIIFTGIFFVGYFLVFEPENFLGWPIIASIFFTSYMMKWIIAFLDTPFLYLARKMKNTADS
ncbi:queuosine precursor transporter [Candidatus Woesearchaeota archaeon]|nr:queuosine precursor transporter [Candidatus Woesearchaeota archaeon]